MAQLSSMVETQIFNLLRVYELISWKCPILDSPEATRGDLPSRNETLEPYMLLLVFR